MGMDGVSDGLPVVPDWHPSGTRPVPPGTRSRISSVYLIIQHLWDATVASVLLHDVVEQWSVEDLVVTLEVESVP